MNPTEDDVRGSPSGPAAPSGKAAWRMEDPRVLAAVEEFLAAQQAGQTPERQAFLARHPDIATDLAECLDDRLAQARFSAVFFPDRRGVWGGGGRLWPLGRLRPVGEGPRPESTTP